MLVHAVHHACVIMAELRPIFGALVVVPDHQINTMGHTVEDTACHDRLYSWQGRHIT